jgi:hypothetical protein
MAKDPADLTIQILREIQGSLSEVQTKLAEHDRRFDRMQQQIDHRFDRVDRELTDLLDNTIKASGEASVSLVRHENVQRQFAEMELELRELRARLQRLEEKV